MCLKLELKGTVESAGHKLFRLPHLTGSSRLDKNKAMTLVQDPYLPYLQFLLNIYFQADHDHIIASLFSVELQKISFSKSVSKLSS